MESVMLKRFSSLCNIRTVAMMLMMTCCHALRAAEEVAFSRTTIDLGTVVGDLEKSVRFYTQAIGFREVKGFEVDSRIARAAGLIDSKQPDSKPLFIRVLVLGEGPEATKLKLMQIGNTKTGDNEFIHSHTGFRYLTIMVDDTLAALDRLEKFGVKPLAESPVLLPETLAPGGIFLTCIRDPDGNIVELVGPKKK